MVRRLDLWLSTGVLAVLVPYWLVWSWVGPVTNGDAQVYNLARLWLIDADGLFFNRSYTAITQLIMPWSFDAVHYPFLHLRMGYALPSFVCLLGMMLLAYAWVRERGGTAADGWRACLGFMAMPMAVMQATTTKNDLVLAFCLFCWVEALRRYSARSNRWSILLAALALAFLAGSKLTGALYAPVAAAVSFWVLRRRPADAAWFAGALALMLALNGSGEIYLNNYLQFGDWRGDPGMYRANANNDGWRGFVANELRYVTGLLDLQLLPSHLQNRFSLLKFEVCQALLKTLSLEGMGLISPTPGRLVTDDSLLQAMLAPVISEGRATFGIIGTLMVTLGPAAFLVRRRSDFPGALFLGGAVAQVLAAATLGWYPGGARYLTAAACLAWAGMSLLVTSERHRWLALVLTVVLAAGAAQLPFSAQRSPDNLVVAFRDRDALLSPFAQAMIRRAETWRSKGEVPVVLTASGGQVFHLYDRLRQDLISIRDLSEEDLVKLDEVHRRGEYHIIAIGVPEPQLPGAVCEPAGALGRVGRIDSSEVRICVWRRR